MTTDDQYPYNQSGDRSGGDRFTDPYAATRAYGALDGPGGDEFIGGFDRAGFDRQGYDRAGFDRAGFDRDGYDAAGFDRSGFDRYGLDRDGLDRAGRRPGERALTPGAGPAGAAGGGVSSGMDATTIAVSVGRRSLLLVAVAAVVCWAATLALSALDSALPQSYRGGAAPVDVSMQWGIGAGLLAGVIASVVGLVVLLLGGTPAVVSLIGYAGTVIVVLLWYQDHRGLSGQWPTTTAQMIVLTLAGVVVTASASSMLLPAAVRRARAGGW